MGQHPDLMCRIHGHHAPIAVSDRSAVSDIINNLARLYHVSTTAGTDAAQYWADISVNSKIPLAPLADIPGAFAALWTPETAPKTTLTLSTAAYNFAGIRRSLVHFTTEDGAAGIAASRAINASRGLHGLFGPGVYMARIGPP